MINRPKEYRIVPETNRLSYEKQVFSQHGEDGILEFLSSFILDKNKNFLEIGWGRGKVNCCRNLLENLNFSGTGVDAKTPIIFHNNLKTVTQLISLDDVNFLISLEGKEPTVFSLDIDSFDWHLLKSMLVKGFLPKIICHEYNSILDELRPYIYISNESYYTVADLRAMASFKNIRGAYKMTRAQLHRRLRRPKDEVYLYVV